jgi:TonB family protein
MTKTLSVILFAVTLPAVCFCQSPSAADLLKDIDAQGSAWSANHSFLLEGDFVTQLHKAETGHFTAKWAAKDLWQEETTLGDFHQIAVRKDDQTFTARNLAFTPLPVREILEVLAPRSVRPTQWNTGKAKLKQRGANECIELRNPTREEWKREICVNLGTKQVISDETNDLGGVRRKEFSDYQPFLNTSVPRTLKLIIDGIPVLTVVVTLLEEHSYTASDFVPPANAVIRRTCANMVPPKVIRAPDPTYPPSEREKRLSGTSIVSVTVLPDGSVTDVYLVGSSYHDMDVVTEQIVKTWKFKPAMCAAEPVTTDIQVQVNFRTR